LNYQVAPAKTGLISRGENHSLSWQFWRMRDRKRVKSRQRSLLLQVPSTNRDLCQQGTFEPALQHSKVKLFTDSQAAAKIIQVGSMTFNLHQMTFAIFSICLKARIELDIQWIPRSLNEKSDYLSKIIDYDDWEIAPKLFRLFEGKFGPHTVDCFADYNN
jgi:hypothetical protein